MACKLIGTYVFLALLGIATCVKNDETDQECIKNDEALEPKVSDDERAPSQGPAMKAETLADIKAVLAVPRPSYSELQRVSKIVSIKANQKRAVLRKELEKIVAASEEPSTTTNTAEPKPEEQGETDKKVAAEKEAAEKEAAEFAKAENAAAENANPPDPCEILEKWEKYRIKVYIPDGPDDLAQKAAAEKACAEFAAAEKAAAEKETEENKKDEAAEKKADDETEAPHVLPPVETKEEAEKKPDVLPPIPTKDEAAEKADDKPHVLPALPDEDEAAGKKAQAGAEGGATTNTADPKPEETWFDRNFPRTMSALFGNKKHTAA